MTANFRQPLAPFMLVFSALCVCLSPLVWTQPACGGRPDICISSLEELTIPAMRKRSYHSDFRVLEALTSENSVALMTQYDSDGLRLYSRLDLPPAPPPEGTPIVVLAAGWISREAALTWDFGAAPDTTVGTVRASLVDHGFAVLTVGYRGRGTVDGRTADGMEFRDAWGNGSYLSPMFYAMDLLNAIAGLGSLQDIDWRLWHPSAESLHFKLDSVSLWGHSQGGDVATTALAVIAANERFPQPIKAASVWSGNIPDRFTQANTFGPMGSSLEAFMSGDGTWTGSATGQDGQVNEEFVFPWPADWIGTIDTQSTDWTWQAEQWSTPTVAAALAARYDEMYATLNAHVKELDGLQFSLEKDGSGRTVIKHAPAVAQQVPRVGAFNHAHYINIPLALHISDRDYYSIPEWNHEFARRITSASGASKVYIYPGTNHALRASEHAWFSPPGTLDGVPTALARDRHLFRGQGMPD